MNASDLILQILVKSEIIPPGYTGQVIFHFGSGHLSAIEKGPKDKVGLKERLNGMNDFFLDKILGGPYNLANNSF